MKRREAGKERRNSTDEATRCRDPVGSEVFIQGREPAPGGESTEVAPAQLSLPQRIGRYRIKRVIGSGGMGTVYEALQDHPRRSVALKVMKPGIASRSALRRFEYESQILARLRHPNIAQVYEAGTYDDPAAPGQSVPYFAMEYIPNPKTLIEYASQKKLDVRERMQLFTKVCDAVGHGHQKGIIHRDLKPGNMLVDSAGQPKIIDFGVARATDSDMAVTTAQTDVGQLIGTLQYMSPEQCEADPQDLDIRSDVYALGVVLYELLCGELPYDVSRAPVHEAARIIREESPPRPSTSNRRLRGDIETITLKALEKDRDRRYQSSAELSKDIQRYLDDEPIEARPPSVMYQLRMLARRNKVAFFAIVGVLIILIAAALVRREWAAILLMFGIIVLMLGIGGTSWGLSRASRARREALKQRDSAVRARADVQAAKQESDRQRDEAQRQSYIANLAAADAALRDNAISTAKRRLAQAPKHLRNWEWFYLSNLADQSLATLRGHEGWVNSVAYSPDSTRIASASRDQTIKIWDAATGNDVATLRGHEHHFFGVSCVAYSPDGTRIASGSGDKMIKIWDASTGEELATLRGHDDRVYSVAFSPDGSRLASGSQDSTLRLWNTSTGEAIATIHGHEGCVAVAYGPDGTRIASGSEDKTIKIRDAATGKEFATLRGHDDGVCFVAFSPDGARIVSGSNDKTIKIWDSSTGKELATLRGHESVVFSVALSPDGTRIASGSFDNTIKLWDAATGEELATLRGHESIVMCVAFSPEGRRVASGAADSTIKLWDVPTGEELATLRGHHEAISSVVFSPDGARVASGGNDTTIRLWDVVTGQELATLRGHTHWILSLAYSADGTRLASGSGDNTIKLWDAATGEHLATLQGHEGVIGDFQPQAVEHAIFAIAFSPDGTRLASASFDNTIKIWDPVRAEELATLCGHEVRVFCVAFSPDGTRFASGSEDKTIKLWDVSTGKELATLRAHEQAVRSIAFSPNGTCIASGSFDNTIRLWDASTGKELATLRGHTSSIESLDFSPDATRLASGSWDRTIKLWDPSTREELVTLRGHDYRIQSIQFSPDGTLIASGSGDKTIRLWDRTHSHERLQQRDEARRARETGRPIVDRLFDQGLEPSQIVQCLRDDESLTELLRRAALNLVLKRSAQRQEEQHDK